MVNLSVMTVTDRFILVTFPQHCTFGVIVHEPVRCRYLRLMLYNVV